MQLSIEELKAVAEFAEVIQAIKVCPKMSY